MRSFFASLLLLLAACTGLRAQFVTIPDANFVIYLQTNYPTCMSGNQMDTTCIDITNATFVNVSNKNIADLEGIQYFDALMLLNADNNLLTSLPPLPPTLVTLRAGINQLTALPPLPPHLAILIMGSNQLATLPPLPGSLTSLYIGQNPGIVLPPLPSGLLDLDIQDCNFSTLPALPSGLISLICANNPLGTIGALPPTLQVLEMLNVQLVTFPTLPSTLTHLGLAGNNVPTLPAALPPGLQTLYCNGNALTSLPPLPATLGVLLCHNNALTALPPLPAGLVRLECGHNQIAVMPALPPGLQSIIAEFNLLTSMGPIPASCYSAAFNDNQITCFAPFPQGNSLNLYIVNNPFTCLPNYATYMTPAAGTVPICTPGNAMGCVAGEGMGGLVYDDLNLDCIRNGVEPGAQNVPVKVYDNSGAFVQGGVTHESGAYFYTQGLGNWTVAVDTVGKPYRVACAYPGLDTAVTLSVGAALVQGLDFAVECKPGFDVGVNAVGLEGLLFPGQPFSSRVYGGDLSNVYGMHCATGVAGQVIVSYSGPATYVGPMAGSLTPAVSGNTFTYTIADFGTVNPLVDFGLNFTMLTTATVADTICFAVTVTPSAGDNVPSNNTYTFCAPVRNSHDPNAKEVYPATVPPLYDGWLTYTVHFQNTGSAPAFNIHVEDTLDGNLDWSTMEMLAASHYQTWTLTGNALAVYFPNIMLADSASDPAGSQGWFMYRVKPKANLALGTVIPNSAAIYFDFNAPVVTNTATTSYNLVTGLRDQVNAGDFISVFPNPSAGIFNVEYPAAWKNADWTVTNLMGQVLLQGKADRNGFAVDLATQPAGFYLLQVGHGNARMVRQIVKR